MALSLGSRKSSANTSVGFSRGPEFPEVPDSSARISLARLLVEVEAAPVVRVEVDSSQFYNAPIAPLLMIISYGAQAHRSGHVFDCAGRLILTQSLRPAFSSALLHKVVAGTNIFAVQSCVVDLMYSVGVLQMSPNGIT